MPKMGRFGPFGAKMGHFKWHIGCPNQNSKTTFRDPNHTQNPHLDTLGTFFGPRKVFFGHFVNFAYFWLVLECKNAKRPILEMKMASNQRKQTGFKIQFYNRKKVSRFY